METKKQAYAMPIIERVTLDNEISLILVSGSPGEPGAMNESPTYFNSEPFKTDLA